MPVVRNPQFYFKEGLCWSEIKTHYIRCRVKEKSINSNKSMSFYPFEGSLPVHFIITLLNSSFIADYVNSFINNTQTFGIDDARQLPIVIPSNNEITVSCNILSEAIRIIKTKQKYSLANLQKQVDRFVEEIYQL